MLRVKRLITAAAVAALVTLGVAAAPAMAQQNRQRGLVNVAVYDVIGDITIQDVNVGVGVAADIAANVCGIAVPVAVLAEQVIAGGGEFTCTNAPGDTLVTIAQQ